MMYKIFYLILLVGSLGLAQQNESHSELAIAQNEISVNLPLTTFGQFPMFSYERLSSADLGYGASAGFGLGDEAIDISFQLVPFVRWYFMNTGNETVFGRRFFIEANASVFSFDDYSYDWDTGAETTESEIGGGLGLGVGYKYVNKSNWMGSIYIGGGKNFADDDDGYTVYPHMGINIGKRF